MLVGIAGCVIEDPNHCHNSGVLCEAGLVCDPCAPSDQFANGCVAPEEVSDQDPGLAGCQGGGSASTSGVTATGVAPTAESSSTSIETESVDPDGTATETDTDTETSTGPPQPCMNDDECMGSTPFCGDEGVCVNCAGVEPGRCVEVDPSLPLCLNGDCVQCIPGMDTSQCSGAMPYCDPGSNLCAQCSEHEHCGDVACNFFTGECLSDQVLHVGQLQEFGTIQAALSAIVMGERSTIVLHQGVDFNESVTVDGGRVVGILAAQGESPRWTQTSSASPQMTIAGGTVIADRLRLEGHSEPAPAVRVDSGFAWFDRMRVVGNTAGAMEVNGGAEQVVARGSFLGGGNNAVVVDVQDAAVEILYSTIGANFGSSTGLSCNGGAVVTVRNSIITSRSAEPEVSCDVDARNTSSETLLPGEGNVGGMEHDDDWFNGYAAGDFSLSDMGAMIFMNVATWETGDPTTDIDGDPRPNVDGTADYAGADIP